MSTKKNNKGQARAWLVWTRPKTSNESGNPPRATTCPRGRREKREFVSEQFMSGDSGCFLDQREVPGVYPGLPAKPLPDKTGRHLAQLGKSTLPSSDSDGPLNGFLTHCKNTSLASHSFQEPGSWTAQKGSNSLASMSSTKKRALTAEEKAAAKVIEEAVRRSDKTQDQIAAEVGVSQGQIYQWMSGKLPVPAARAQKLATAIELHPSQVSIAWRGVVRESKSLKWPFKKIDPIRWVHLTPGQQIRIEGLVLGEITDLENSEKRHQGSR